MEAHLVVGYVKLDQENIFFFNTKNGKSQLGQWHIRHLFPFFGFWYGRERKKGSTLFLSSRWMSFASLPLFSPSPPVFVAEKWCFSWPSLSLLLPSTQDRVASSWRNKIARPTLFWIKKKWPNLGRKLWINGQIFTDASLLTNFVAPTRSVYIDKVATKRPFWQPWLKAVGRRKRSISVSVCPLLWSRRIEGRKKKERKRERETPATNPNH